MRKFIMLGSAILALTSAAAAAAGSPAMHFEEDITGDVFVCEDETYTTISGTIAITVHEGASASGNGNFTFTAVPKDAVAEDTEGNTYRGVGAVWGGGAFNAQKGSEQGTFTFKITFVSAGGGKADSVNLVMHGSTSGANFEFDKGTCAEDE